MRNPCGDSVKVELDMVLGDVMSLIEKHFSPLITERDSLRSKLAEANAGCAEMREAIRKVLNYFNGIDRCLHLRYELKETSGGVWSYQYLQDTLQATLSSSCGKDLLERVGGLEAVVEAIRADIQRTFDYYAPGGQKVSPCRLPLSVAREWAATIDAYLNPKSPATASQDDDPDDQGDADDDPGSDDPEASGSEPKEGKSRG